MEHTTNIFETVLVMGVSVIAYFLKLIHGDLRAALKQLHDHETRLAVGAKTFQELSRRIEDLEEKG